MTKVIKYQPLLQTITELGYRCNLLVFIFGSLGHVHRLVVRGFQQLGMPKKQLNGLQNSMLSLLPSVAAKYGEDVATCTLERCAVIGYLS